MKTLIIIVVIPVIIVIAASIIIGIKSFEGTVTEHPYEEGIAWDETRRKKAELGWNVVIEKRDLRIGQNEIFILTLDKFDKPLADAEIALMISRPATSAYDREFDTIKLSEGRFRTTIDFPLYGYWDIIIQANQNGNNISYKQKVFVEKGG
jgi:nitrogen fixation protein FixH